MTDVIEQLAALAKIERDLAAKFQTDRVGLGQWIAAMGAINGYIRENLPAILALGRENAELRARLDRIAHFPTSGMQASRDMRAIARQALEGGNQ